MKIFVSTSQVVQQTGQYMLCKKQGKVYTVQLKTELTWIFFPTVDKVKHYMCNNGTTSAAGEYHLTSTHPPSVKVGEV
jgi:hypothetical protein